MARRSRHDLNLLQRGLAASILQGKPPAGKRRKREDDDDGDHEYRGRSEDRSERRGPVLRSRKEEAPKPKGYVDSVTAKPRER